MELILSDKLEERVGNGVFPAATVLFFASWQKIHCKFSDHFNSI